MDGGTVEERLIRMRRKTGLRGEGSFSKAMMPLPSGSKVKGKPSPV